MVRSSGMHSFRLAAVPDRMTILAKLQPIEDASEAPVPAQATSRWLQVASVCALLLAVSFSAFVRLRWRNMPL
jgi:hypothetical protein